MIRVALPGLVGVALLTSCLSPTQVTVELSTDVPCSSHPVTTIAVGTPGKAEVDKPQTTTTACANGSIGTIVVTPGSAGDTTFEVQVVLSVGVEPSDCNRANDYMPSDAPAGAGCIVARRELAFLPHTPLKLPITLDTACIGQKCPDGETCVAEGTSHTCKKATSCDLSQVCPTSSSVGAGGAGMGGSMSPGSSTGTAGATGSGGGPVVCDAASDCTRCSQNDCKPVGPGAMFSGCFTPPRLPTAMNCTLHSPDDCCSDAECATGSNPAPQHCVGGPLNCGISQKFVCATDAWYGAVDCGVGKRKVYPGFLGFKANGCLEATCIPGGGGCGLPQDICYPVHTSCCAQPTAFACISKSEPCCDFADCAENMVRCMSHGADSLVCAQCVAMPGDP